MCLCTACSRDAMLVLVLQCADIIADYEAARLAEVHDFLQSLAHHRQAGQAAHELWLASRCVGEINEDFGTDQLTGVVHYPSRLKPSRTQDLCTKYLLGV